MASTTGQGVGKKMWNVGVSSAMTGLTIISAVLGFFAQVGTSFGKAMLEMFSSSTLKSIPNSN